MDFQIKMMVKAGDTHVSKATVEVFDGKAASYTKQVILEGETVETMLNVPPGGRIEVKEVERPLVYDAEQKAAVPMDLTPKDPLTDPNRPKPDNTLPGEPAKKPEAGHATASGSSIKPNNVVDTKPATSPLKKKP